MERQDQERASGMRKKSYRETRGTPTRKAKTFHCTRPIYFKNLDPLFPKRNGARDMFKVYLISLTDDLEKVSLKCQLMARKFINE